MVKPVGRTCPRCKERLATAGGYCPPCRTEYGREYRKRTEVQQRALGANRRLKAHGLTPETYAAMLTAQGDCCGICGATEPGGYQGWHIDHDHSCCPRGTEKGCGRCVRGVLCFRCNIGLGMFSDDRSRLVAAIEYLEKSWLAQAAV